MERTSPMKVDILTTGIHNGPIPKPATRESG